MSADAVRNELARQLARALAHLRAVLAILDRIALGSLSLRAEEVSALDAARAFAREPHSGALSASLTRSTALPE